MKRTIVAVIGHDKHSKKNHLDVAKRLGEEIAKKGWVLLCGGRNSGVMESAAKGAKKYDGLTVGILPFSDMNEVSNYIDIPILTGIGFARMQIIAFSCDAVIVVGGGTGTLVEAAYAYLSKKPIVVIKNLGSILDRYIGKFMDEKKIIKVLGADSVEEAIKLVEDLIGKKK